MCESPDLTACVESCSGSTRIWRPNRPRTDVDFSECLPPSCPRRLHALETHAVCGYPYHIAWDVSRASQGYCKTNHGFEPAATCWHHQPYRHARIARPQEISRHHGPSSTVKQLRKEIEWKNYQRTTMNIAWVSCMTLRVVFHHHHMQGSNLRHVKCTTMYIQTSSMMTTSWPKRLPLCIEKEGRLLFDQDAHEMETLVRKVFSCLCLNGNRHLARPDSFQLETWALTGTAARQQQQSTVAEIIRISRITTNSNRYRNSSNGHKNPSNRRNTQKQHLQNSDHNLTKKPRK